LIREPGNMSPGSKNNPFPAKQMILAGRKQYMWQRARMIQAMRLFFIEHDYLEVETPQLIPAPAPEPHIHAISADNLFLHTSPELCMKRMLAAGYPKIFQIGKCFRHAERGNLHMPEFTMLEWYRTGIDYMALMEECEAMIRSVSRSLGAGNRINYQGTEIDLKCPCERLSVSEAFDRWASLTPETAIGKGIFDKVMVEKIEPNLGVTRPTILYDYPAPLAALARLKPENRELAERFEIYFAGLELANGFSELTDAREQRARFERDMKQRSDSDKQVYPMPEKFLKALEKMPRAAGIALGVDRLAMIFADRSGIDDVVTFTPEEV
jgi:lysyl-tRNA synthetase class 2